MDPKPASREFLELTWTSLQALGAVAPRWIESFAGDWRTWLRWRELSEFQILDPARPGRLARYLTEAGIPGLWRPTGIFHWPDHEGDYTSHGDEKWFFINGIATNRDLARVNAGLLARMFHRPITVIHNSTNSWALDVLESAVGKAWTVMTEPARVGFPLLIEALNDKCRKRVIVVCHSQGTIIMSNLLRALDEADFRKWLFSAEAGASRLQSRQPVKRVKRRDVLRKLEIYAFSNCADRMSYAAPQTATSGHPAPWIESFGNEMDFVARLGMLAPDRKASGIEIDGPAFVQRGALGHLLNEHYLLPIDEYLTEKRRDDPFPFQPTNGSAACRPRLYQYFEGHRPGPY